MGDLVNDRELFTINTYVTDKESTIGLIRWFLKSIFLWSRLTKTSNVNFSKFFIFTGFSAMLITTVNMPLVFFIEERGNIDLMMTHIGSLVCVTMGVMKYIFLLLHVDDIRICVDNIELDWNIVKSNEDHDVMLRDTKIGRLVATSLTASMHGVMVFFFITPYLMKNVVEVDNVNISFHELPFPFYHKILDVRFSPAYEIGLFIEIISSFFLVSIFSTSCGLMVIFVMHACGQLKILTMWLGDIVHDDDFINVNAVQQKLGLIVEHHLRVIK